MYAKNKATKMFGQESIAPINAPKQISPPPIHFPFESKYWAKKNPAPIKIAKNNFINAPLLLTVDNVKNTPKITAINNAGMEILSGMIWYFKSNTKINSNTDTKNKPRIKIRKLKIEN